MANFVRDTVEKPDLISMFPDILHRNDRGKIRALLFSLTLVNPLSDRECLSISFGGHSLKLLGDIPTLQTLLLQIGFSENPSRISVCKACRERLLEQSQTQILNSQRSFALADQLRE